MESARKQEQMQWVAAGEERGEGVGATGTDGAAGGASEAGVGVEIRRTAAGRTAAG